MLLGQLQFQTDEWRERQLLAFSNQLLTKKTTTSDETCEVDTFGKETEKEKFGDLEQESGTLLG